MLADREEEQYFRPISERKRKRRREDRFRYRRRDMRERGLNRGKWKK